MEMLDKFKYRFFICNIDFKFKLLLMIEKLFVGFLNVVFKRQFQKLCMKIFNKNIFQCSNEIKKRVDNLGSFVFFLLFENF